MQQKRVVKMLNLKIKLQVLCHCLAIDWLCIATLQSRHKSATQLTPASPYLIRWYSGKSAKNQEHCVWHQLLIPVCKSVSDTNSQKSDFGLMMYTVDIIIVWFWNMVLEYFSQMQNSFLQRRWKICFFIWSMSTSIKYIFLFSRPHLQVIPQYLKKI